MANVGNTSVSTSIEELNREITELKDEIEKLWAENVQLHHPTGRPDVGAIEEVKKKLKDKKVKLEELSEKMKEVKKEMEETHE
ncbi:PREDICTED: uncharacterized protein LOC104717327 [Camelina sativa]|uniref:Uncharacterized protein LOC104717327 n=1 Tax=Camelina sativa TaxID=90675 RepID=A0ABM0TYA8_CAMSA|nr:PREDICTED: uncharacterized protein LOC104717327 [Camelina sativa]